MSHRRVTLVSDYSFDTLGGAETALFEQARALASRAEVTVVAPLSARMPELARGSAATVVGVPARVRLPGLGLPLVPNTGAVRDRLRRLLRERGSDVVHLHSEFGLAAAATAVAHELGLPVVQTVHTFFWQTTWPVQRLLAVGAPRFHRALTGLASTTVRLDARPGNSALRNMTLTQAGTVERVLSPSAHQAETLRRAGLPHVDVVPNALGTPVSGARVLERVDGPLTVLWIGRLVPEKRPLSFLRAGLEAVGRLGPGRLRLLVVGDGEQLAEARSLVAGCPDVELLGRQPHARVLELLAQAHLCALTSVGWDNQPMTVVEAVSSLRGVLYCDPALTEGLTSAGILSPAPEDRLADTLVRLVHHPEEVVAASAGAEQDRLEFAPSTFADRAMASYDLARHRL
ncbi:glycosyltransferase family 4 protein [Auraticoccus monumenti]|uniref:Glycosyltransferase involved in cell wall bisynthesis n=1 Tax=Auraticoccus monumenti TaxID=675864 RepID=A0A1G7EJT5_9ACTN|nr:glycosyltransferase family 4 protein [Auraticoccus monumenti]SDE63932.1 Glycosyltransferase involved in cell wall bisynthesis [Auraticoccus monumenti]